MRLPHPCDTSHPATRGGFTLVELMVSVTVIAISFASVYMGISSAFGIVQATRDDLRATQILNEKMETMRLYTWSQIMDPNAIPSGFTNYFYETANASQGTRYIGTVSFSSPGFSNSFSEGMRRVTVTVRWVQGTRTNSRQTMSLVSSNGLQSYILE
jgi:prepilin-type N-terminal cleavage/methylation domain-containing protein